MLDLAVAGGGLAGTYCAYRAAAARPGWSIGLFEAGARAGGRLLSLRAPGVDAPRAELGGMRFRSSQPLVSAIVEELGLATRPFLFAHDDNRFHLRGSVLRAADFAGGRHPYDVAAPFDTLSPTELIVAAFEKVVPGASALSAEDWLDVKRNHRFGDRYLRDWGLGELLRAVTGDEGYALIVDGFGYTSPFAERNAADAMPWFLIETRPDSENRTLVDGMEALPRELARRFADGGGRVAYRHRLESVESLGGDAGYRLRFAGGATVEARRVVLALPQGPLTDVVGRSDALADDAVGRLLASVTPHAMAKLFLVYERPWWRDGSGARRWVSDGRLQKTYLFDLPDSRDDAPALLLASYCDGPAAGHWRASIPLAAAPEDGWELDAAERWAAYAVEPAVLEEAHGEVSALRDDAREAPLSGAFMDWGVAPFGAAWHLWEPGVRSWDVTARLASPWEHESIYVCGEAYSIWQGWCEGALESAELALERVTAS